MSTMPRHFPPRRGRLSRSDRELLFARAAGRCEVCEATEITLETFHEAHRRAVASGGATVLENMVAACAQCNLAQGASDLDDPRIPPRIWQVQGLSAPIDIPRRIIQAGVATIAAAPGAGKTVFAGLVFERLYELDHVDRMVVFTPRVALVTQWHEALLRSRHIALSMNQAHERTGALGTIVTYQSLSASTVRVHLARATSARTLLVFDEAHHLADLLEGNIQPAWARAAKEISGEIGDLRVVGVLNLSGTLWRSLPRQRVATVRYTEPDAQGKVASLVDQEVTARYLIDEQQLRPIDLYRLGATIEAVDLRTASMVAGPIADLGDDDGLNRAVIRQLPRDPEWRGRFVDAIIDRLRLAHRDLGGRVPVKALIVASSQGAARAFRDTANERMRARGYSARTVLAISDEREALTVLRQFKASTTPGILVTVDMAGEGYDCAAIMVIGFASNKLTPLYVRQVVARAQRVTEEEIRQLGRPLPASVIVPDVQAVVEHMTNILEPMRHEVDETTTPPPPPPPPPDWDEPRDVTPRYSVDVTDIVGEQATVVGVEDGNVPMDFVRRLQPFLRTAGLPESEAARVAWSALQAVREGRATSPFDPPSDEERRIEDWAPTAPERRPPRWERLAETEQARLLQGHLHRLAGWWAHNGTDEMAVDEFNARVNTAGRIPRGDRAIASLQQLAAAYAGARDLILQRCARTHQQPPLLIEPGERD
jgi:superfamily II DNA or RNA helicase